MIDDDRLRTRLYRAAGDRALGKPRDTLNPFDTTLTKKQTLLRFILRNTPRRWNRSARSASNRLRSRTVYVVLASYMSRRAIRFERVLSRRALSFPRPFDCDGRIRTNRIVARRTRVVSSFLLLLFFSIFILPSVRRTTP